MKRSTIDIAVGLFVLIGILCIGYLAIRLGKMEVLGSDDYALYARFESVSGLKAGASIEMAGVPIGHVDSITLDTERQVAVVKMKIQKEIIFTDDVIVSVKTAGLIGDKYIKVSPGGSEDRLKPGDMITETESAVDLEELISKYVFGGV